ERVGGPCGEDSLEGGGARGRGVRAYAVLAVLRGSEWRGGGSRRRRLGRQLLEAGERLGVAVGVEELPAPHETVDAEDIERDEAPLEAAAAGAVRTEVRPAHEERVGSEAENIVEVKDEVVRDLEQGVDPASDRLGSAEGRKAERPVVDVLTVRRDDRVDGVRVWAPQDRDRARRRRGAGARGAVGEEAGVALVQPDESVGQPVGGEPVRPSAPA